MKITRIRIYCVDLPMINGPYSWGAGQSAECLQTTVVEIETDAGLFGYGESCPIGGTYLPAYPLGVKPGVEWLAPVLIGRDPTDVVSIYQTMDDNLRGHPYVKTAIDMACWDLLGKVTGQPCWKLFGGRQQDAVALHVSISQDRPERMLESVAEYRAKGFRHFQLKVGGRAEDDIERLRAIAPHIAPDEVLIADGNTGWKPHEALRVLQAVRDLDFTIEQPCLTYEECLGVRRAITRPMKLDECMDSVSAIVRGHSDRAMDAISLKIGRVGGPTKARLIRDLCADLGVLVNIEDTWGSDIATAATAHLAVSTAESVLFNASELNGYFSVSIADGAPRAQGGRLGCSNEPGLGVQPIFEVLGDPVASLD